MWVLVEVTRDRDTPLYFKQMTGIGPMTTPNLEEAAKFESKEEAYQSPACKHMLSFYEAKEVK